ncbi:MAG: TetR/AcrR family transcriptional regulator [Bacteroidales bacterium]|jgi:AcrR family transcriptional regulator|nr:TetR/AcrR family transcriptional regulator [Bacteroidales bacterium]
MKILKDDKYNSILQAAKNEFITKGYKETSMRNIAKNANIGLSNIYNYFKSKDEIYLAIVKPAEHEIFTFITKKHAEENVDFNNVSTFGHQEEDIEHYISLIEKYKEELRLLFYHSQGSSMNNFRDTFTDYLTQVSHNYMELEKKYIPGSNKISQFFIHTMSSRMVSILGEIVSHDLSRQKIKEFFHEYFRFEYAGWRELTGT